MKILLAAVLVVTPALAACIAPPPAVGDGEDIRNLWAEGASDLGCFREMRFGGGETRLDPALLAAIRNSSAVERPPEPAPLNETGGAEAPALVNETEAPASNLTDEAPSDHGCAPLVEGVGGPIYYKDGRWPITRERVDFVLYSPHWKKYVTLVPTVRSDDPQKNWPEGYADYGSFTGLPYQELEIRPIANEDVAARYGDVVVIGARHPTQSTLYYLRATEKGALRVDATNPGKTEQFTFVNPSNPGSTAEIERGGKVALKSSFGKYVVADRTGWAKWSTLRADRDAIGPWEIFEFDYGVRTDFHKGSDTDVRFFGHLGNPYAPIYQPIGATKGGYKATEFSIAAATSPYPIRCGEWFMLRTTNGLLTAHEQRAIATYDGGRISDYQNSQGSHQRWWIECKDRPWGTKVQEGDKIGLRNDYHWTLLTVRPYSSDSNYLAHVARDNIGEWETFTIHR